MANLRGRLSFESSAKTTYNGKPLELRYKLELRRYVDKKVSIKQFVLERKFPRFDITRSEEIPSNLAPLSAQVQPTAKLQPSKPQLPREDPVKPQPIKEVPETPKLSAMEEEELAPPQVASSGISHPLAGDLKILPKAEFTTYLGQLKAVKPAIEKQGLEMNNLINFEKTSFSCKFLTIYLERLEKQQEDFINGKTVDTESVKKCRDLINELTKRNGQIERNLQSGKLQASEYKDVLQNEFEGLLGEAKFVKKFVKNQQVFKFLYAKAQIIDSEIKELEEYLKM